MKFLQYILPFCSYDVGVERLIQAILSYHVVKEQEMLEEIDDLMSYAVKEGYKDRWEVINMTYAERGEYYDECVSVEPNDNLIIEPK